MDKDDYEVMSGFLEQNRATKAAFLRGAFNDIKGKKAKGFALFLLSEAENSELVQIEWFRPNPRRREELKALCLNRFERMEDVFHGI
jgi:hypothetical protein